jgi:hypothetical protein
MKKEKILGAQIMQPNNLSFLFNGRAWINVS